MNGYRTIQFHLIGIDYGAFTELQDTAEKHLRLIIESAVDVSREPHNPDIRKIGDFYRTGMDLVTIEEEGMAPLKEEFDRIAALADTSDLHSLIAYLATCGINPLFGFFAETDPKDSTMMIAGMSQGGLGLPNRDYYTRDDAESMNLRKDYANHIRNMHVLLGDLPIIASEDADIVMNIETRLAHASNSPEENRDPELTYHKMSRSELVDAYPEFNWNTFFSEIGYPGISLVNIHQPRYFRELSRMTVLVPLNEWKIFLRWKLMSGLAPYLDSRIEQENFAFYGKRLNGQREMKPRWKRVVASTNDALGDAIGKIYVENYFPAASKHRIGILVGDLKDILRRRIEKLGWMDQETKKEALEKLQSMQFKIGYPDKWQDYRELKVYTGGYVRNILSASRYDVRSGPHGLEKIGKPVDHDAWFMTPQTVNAYYDQTLNEIVFPAAILQPPFFNAEGDDATNYGAIGAVIGHEMTHGFDDMGRKYDKDGNLRDWWTKVSAREYARRVQLLVDQYSAFEVIPGLNMNGHLTLGENIADFGGITLAYFAYIAARDRSEGAGKEHVQDIRRFFLGFASIWRESVRIEALRNGVLSDVHAPGRFRVNGTLFNMPEFYEAFPEIPPENRFFRAPEQRPVIW